MANALVNVRFIPNTYGGLNLVHLGYKYRIKTRKDNSVHWTCCKKNCPATINTNSNNRVTTYRNIHSHPSDDTSIAVDEFLANMKTKAKTGSKTMPSLYNEEVSGKT